jgi:hypothetical protein
MTLTRHAVMRLQQRGKHWGCNPQALLATLKGMATPSECSVVLARGKEDLVGVVRNGAMVTITPTRASQWGKMPQPVLVL